MDCAALGSCVLPLLEAGEQDNESYKTDLFVPKFLQLIATENEYSAIGHRDYVKVLDAALGHCCQHDDRAACDLLRCSWHVSKFLGEEKRALFAYQTICFCMGRMNTVPMMHLVFTDMAGLSFALCDLYGGNEFKRVWALKQAHSMRRMAHYILDRWDRRTVVAWLQSAAEWQCECEYSKRTYRRLVAEVVGIELGAAELGVERALQSLSLATK
jgi:hypothetical protein